MRTSPTYQTSRWTSSFPSFTGGIIVTYSSRCSSTQVSPSSLVSGTKVCTKLSISLLTTMCSLPLPKSVKVSGVENCLRMARKMMSPTQAPPRNNTPTNSHSMISKSQLHLCLNSKTSTKMHLLFLILTSPRKTIMTTKSKVKTKNQH
jgi:hypothetical protein